MSRAAQLNCQHGRSCALVLTLFLFQKGQGFFPPLPIAALPRRSWLWAYLSRAGWDASKWLVGFAALVSERGFFFQLAWGQAYPPAGWDVSVWLGNFAARMNRLIFLTHSRRWAYSPLARWNASMQLVYFCNAKGQREFEFTLAFVASHEACRRMAVYTMQLAGSRTRPASRGTCRATAVKPQPTRMSPYAPARLRRAVRKGAQPLRGTAPA